MAEPPVAVLKSCRNDRRAMGLVDTPYVTAFDRRAISRTRSPGSQLDVSTPSVKAISSERPGSAASTVIAAKDASINAVPLNGLDDVDRCPRVDRTREMSDVRRS